MQLVSVIRSARPAFLVLTPGCVLLGAGLALHADATIDWYLVLLILPGAIAAHISVNALNEYQDYRSGLDLQTRRTPFSGGSGALPDDPASAKAVFALGIVCMGLTVLVGLVLLALRGPALLPLGVAGLVLIAAYTPWVNRYPLICLIAPGLGFGILMVPGSYFVLTGEYALRIFVLALIPFFLSNNLLLLNQYPDIQADRAAGRRHIPIVYGVAIANRVYLTQVAMAASVLLAGVWLQWLPTSALAALLLLIPACYAWSGAVTLGAALGTRPSYLAANVIAAVLMPAGLALILLFA